jgi:acyl-coenzyme A thioesterase PaaI-like protein
VGDLDEGGAALERLAESVRRLIDVTVTVAAPPATLAAATGAIDRIVADLRPFVPSPPPPRYQRPAGSTDPNDYFPYDLVIGRRSPLAPPIHFTWEAPKAIGRVRFGTPYEGPPGCVHGAALAAAFDQVFNVANVMQGLAGPTAKLEILYRRPTPLFEDLRFEGWQERVAGRRIHAAGRLLAGDRVTAEAKGLFVHLPPEDVLHLLAKR